MTIQGLSMKIVRAHFKGKVGHAVPPCGLDMNHVVLVLERSFDKKKLAA